LDFFGRSVIRRALVQISSTMLVMLTFGIAAPAIGLACIFAAIVQFRHHSLVFSQIVSLGEVLKVPSLPKLKRCNRMPLVTCGTLVLTTALFWGCMIIDYMNEAVVIVSFLLIIVVFALFSMALMVKRKCQAGGVNKSGDVKERGGDEAIVYDNKLLLTLAAGNDSNEVVYDEERRMTH
jgi:hypothetical protein